MAIVEPQNRQEIQAAVDVWRERCLIGDGSLLFETEELWTLEHLTRLLRGNRGVEVGERLAVDLLRKDREIGAESAGIKLCVGPDGH